jgi:HSP20 family protein
MKSAEIMNQLVPWNPFNELDHLRRQMTTLLNVNPAAAETRAVETWAPIVDIFEDDHAYIFKAELPEVKKEDVNVQLENGTLSIAGTRKAEKDQKIRRVHRIERPYGAFTRSFELPDDIDADNVDASFKDGVLTVTVAKAVHAMPRKIEVKVA